MQRIFFFKNNRYFAQPRAQFFDKIGSIYTDTKFRSVSSRTQFHEIIIIIYFNENYEKREIKKKTFEQK